MNLDRKIYVALFVEVKWSRTQDLLYSEVEAATGKKARQPPMYITPEGRDSRIAADALASMWKEAVCHAMWYVYTGWINFSTQHAVAIFNEFFVRISVVQAIELRSDNKGLNNKGSGQRGPDKKDSKNESPDVELVLGVEVHPSVTLSASPAGSSSFEEAGNSGLAGLSIAARSPARAVITFTEFLTGSRHDSMWRHPPNSLVADSIGAVRQIDEDAMARLSAQIHLGFFLAATATPSSIERIASSRRPTTDGASHRSRQTSQQACHETPSHDWDGETDEGSNLAGQAAFDDDDIQLGESSGGVAECDARKYLLASKISVLLLHPMEMDALIRHMHGGSVRAPTADLHDWFLSVDPSSSPVSSTLP